MNVDEKLKEDQEVLLEEKVKELTERWEKGEIQTGSKKQKQKNMGLIQSYSSMKRLPPDLKKGSLYVDDQNMTILVPVNYDQFVPFHISTITNVSVNAEGQWTYLRINFHTPSVGRSGADTLVFPDMSDPNAVFIKELTLKNSDHRGDSNHLKKSEKQIKELIKKGKV